MYVCMYTYMCCMHVCMYACTLTCVWNMHACMYACTHVVSACAASSRYWSVDFVYIYIYIYTHTYKYKYAHIHTHAHTSKLKVLVSWFCMCIYVYIYIYTHTHTYKYTYIHIHTCPQHVLQAQGIGQLILYKGTPFGRSFHKVMTHWENLQTFRYMCVYLYVYMYMYIETALLPHGNDRLGQSRSSEAYSVCINLYMYIHTYI